MSANAVAFLAADARAAGSKAEAAMPESTERLEILWFICPRSEYQSQKTIFAAICMMRPSLELVMRPNAELLKELFGFRRLV
jgi:hypothetical protein